MSGGWWGRPGARPPWPWWSPRPPGPSAGTRDWSCPRCRDEPRRDGPTGDDQVVGRFRWSPAAGRSLPVGLAARTSRTGRPSPPRYRHRPVPPVGRGDDAHVGTVGATPGGGGDDLDPVAVGDHGGVPGALRAPPRRCGPRRCPWARGTTPATSSATVAPAGPSHGSPLTSTGLTGHRGRGPGRGGGPRRRGRTNRPGREGSNSPSPARSRRPAGAVRRRQQAGRTSSAVTGAKRMPLR